MATKEEKLRELLEAKKKILDGSLTMWNARLETHVAAGDYEKMLEVMNSSVEKADNIGYGCPCGSDTESGCRALDLGTEWLGELISLAAKKELK